MSKEISIVRNKKRKIDRYNLQPIEEDRRFHSFRGTTVFLAPGYEVQQAKSVGYSDSPRDFVKDAEYIACKRGEIIVGIFENSEVKEKAAEAQKKALEHFGRSREDNTNKPKYFEQLVREFAGDPNLDLVHILTVVDSYEGDYFQLLGYITPTK